MKKNTRDFKVMIIDLLLICNYYYVLQYDIM